MPSPFAPCVHACRGTFQTCTFQTCTFQMCTFADMLTEVYLYALTSGQIVRADWVVQAVVPAARLCWLKS